MHLIHTKKVYWRVVSVVSSEPGGTEGSRLSAEGVCLRPRRGAALAARCGHAAANSTRPHNAGHNVSSNHRRRASYLSGRRPAAIGAGQRWTPATAGWSAPSYGRRLSDGHTGHRTTDSGHARRRPARRHAGAWVGILTVSSEKRLASKLAYRGKVAKNGYPSIRQCF